MTEAATPPLGKRDSPLGSGQETGGKTWRPLRFLTISKLLVAALLVALHHLNRLPPPLGAADHELFYFTSLAYLTFSFLALYPLARRQPPFVLQVSGHILADVVFVTLLMHASGGVGSGVGMLLVISVANGSMLVTGRAPLFFAALASLAILTEQVVTGQIHTAAKTNYPLAGMLGLTLFATAILAHVLARRARESEELAHQRSIDLANMAQLTDYIIQHMQTGVMVIDPSNRIRLMNSSAWRLLDTPMAPPHNVPLREYCPALQQQLQDWLQNPSSAARPMQVRNSPVELLPQFMSIGQQRRDGTLIFLEDAATPTRQAQQLKLASLGRLTGSIAHEIRNPLGALSHAAALLAESPNMDSGDRRLTEIIREQSQRINTIIENVLQLGRRDRTRFEEIHLKPWLERFLTELQHNSPENADAISVKVEPADIRIYFDASHLHQILTNLCQNGLHHARHADEPIKLRLHAGLSSDELGYLDIIDAGPGINEEHSGNIFEPFFTTESNGTGLGLYLSRELAVSNQAQLRYEPTADGQSRFRLLFRTIKGETTTS